MDTPVMEVSNQPEWYRAWFDSPYYHRLYSERDDKEAVAFIERLVDYLQPAQGVRMLDVACGRGRHSTILASKGFQVTGIDLSFSSIYEARALENENLQFFQHDMRLPFWINYYHYAFNFFTSFGYFKTDREHYNVIRTISDSLQENGTFVLDYLNVHYAEDHLVHKEEIEKEGTVFYLTRWFDETHFYKRIIIEDESFDAPLEFLEKVAKFSLGDFNDMFAFHNLQIQEVFGDDHLGSYHIRKSPRLVMVAKKVR